MLLKKYLKILLFIIIAYFITNCSCEKCVDNLSAEFEKVPYKDSSAIEFYNDTLGSVYDTIYIFFEKPEGLHSCFGAQENYSEECMFESSLTYTNLFVITFLQEPIKYDNRTSLGYIYSKLDYIEYSDINYIYKNKNYNAIKISYITDTLGSDIWRVNVSKDSNYVFTDYIYIENPEIKLLEYTTVYKDGSRRKWRLKE